MAELKQCPFCGQSAVEVEYIDYDAANSDYERLGIKCSACPDLIGFEGAKKDRLHTISLWNTRVLSS